MGCCFFLLLLQVSLLSPATVAFLPSAIQNNIRVPSPPAPSEKQQGESVRLSPVIHIVSASKSSEEDGEFIPRDQAETTPQLLRGVWSQISQGSSMVKGVRSWRLFHPLFSPHFQSGKLTYIFCFKIYITTYQSYRTKKRFCIQTWKNKLTIKTTSACL